MDLDERARDLATATESIDSEGSELIRLMGGGRTRPQAQLCLVVRSVAFRLGGSWRAFLEERARLDGHPRLSEQAIRTQVVAISNQVNGRPRSSRPYPSRSAIAEIDRVALHREAADTRERVLTPVRYLWLQIERSPLTLHRDAPESHTTHKASEGSSDSYLIWRVLMPQLQSRWHENERLRSELESATRQIADLHEKCARLAAEAEGTRQQSICAYLQTYRELLRSDGKWPPKPSPRIRLGQIEALIDGDGTLRSWRRLGDVVKAVGGDVDYVSRIYWRDNHPPPRATAR